MLIGEIIRICANDVYGSFSQEQYCMLSPADEL